MRFGINVLNVKRAGATISSLSCILGIDIVNLVNLFHLPNLDGLEAFSSLSHQKTFPEKALRNLKRPQNKRAWNVLLKKIQAK